MDVGVVTRSFPELTNRETAELLAASGFKWTELCFSQTDSKYWVYNGRSDLSDFSDARSRTVVAEYTDRGIAVSAIGVYTNLLEPDETELKKNLAYFERLMEIAATNDVPYVATECGFIPGQRGVRLETYESAFQRLVDKFGWLADRAARHGVVVALEPCVLDVVPSAKRTADFIAQVGSGHQTRPCHVAPDPDVAHRRRQYRRHGCVVPGAAHHVPEDLHFADFLTGPNARGPAKIGRREGVERLRHVHRALEVMELDQVRIALDHDGADQVAGRGCCAGGPAAGLASPAGLHAD